MMYKARLHGLLLASQTIHINETETISIEAMAAQRNSSGAGGSGAGGDEPGDHAPVWTRKMKKKKGTQPESHDTSSQADEHAESTTPTAPTPAIVPPPTTLSTPAFEPQEALSASLGNTFIGGAVGYAIPSGEPRSFIKPPKCTNNNLVWWKERPVQEWEEWRENYWRPMLESTGADEVEKMEGEVKEEEQEHVEATDGGRKSDDFVDDDDCEDDEEDEPLVTYRY